MNLTKTSITAIIIFSFTACSEQDTLYKAGKEAEAGNIYGQLGEDEEESETYSTDYSHVICCDIEGDYQPMPAAFCSAENGRTVSQELCNYTASGNNEASETVESSEEEITEEMTEETSEDSEESSEENETAAETQENCCCLAVWPYSCTTPADGHCPVETGMYINRCEDYGPCSVSDITSTDTSKLPYQIKSASCDSESDKGNMICDADGDHYWKCAARSLKDGRHCMYYSRSVCFGDKTCQWKYTTKNKDLLCQADDSADDNENVSVSDNNDTANTNYRICHVSDGLTENNYLKLSSHFELTSCNEEKDLGNLVCDANPNYMWKCTSKTIDADTKCLYWSRQLCGTKTKNCISGDISKERDDVCTLKDETLQPTTGTAQTNNYNLEAGSACYTTCSGGYERGQVACMDFHHLVVCGGFDYAPNQCTWNSSQSKYCAGGCANSVCCEEGSVIDFNTNTCVK